MRYKSPNTMPAGWGGGGTYAYALKWCIVEFWSETTSSQASQDHLHELVLYLHDRNQTRGFLEKRRKKQLL